MGDSSKSIDMSPASFLRKIMSAPLKEEQQRQYEVLFQKPSEEELASYDSEMLAAVKSKDIDRLREFHMAGRSLNACNRFGESLLHMSCRRGDVDVVRFLVEEAGVRVNARDDYGRTPLHDACWTTMPQTELMDILLRAPEGQRLLLSPDIRGHTPFNYARREHWETWIAFLEERKTILMQGQEGGAIQVVA